MCEVFWAHAHTYRAYLNEVNPHYVTIHPSRSCFVTILSNHLFLQYSAVPCCATKRQGSTELNRMRCDDQAGVHCTHRKARACRGADEAASDTLGGMSSSCRSQVLRSSLSRGGARRARGRGGGVSEVGSEFCRGMGGREGEGDRAEDEDDTPWGS